MITRRESRLWTAVFLLVILAPAVAWLLTDRSNDRFLAEFPTLEIDRLDDAAFYAEIDAAIRDQVPGRPEAQRLEAAVDYSLFGDPTNGAVVPGQDDLLFWREYFDLACGLTPYPATTGSVPVFVLNPLPKWAYYLDAVPPAWRPDPCVAGDHDERLAALVAAGFGVLDEREAFASARGEGLDPFLLQDTHWSPYGRSLIVQALLTAVQPGAERREIIPGSSSSWRNDLRVAMGLDPDTTVAEYGLSGGGPVTVERFQETTYAGEIVAPLRTVSRSTGPNPVPGVTLVIGDSQMAYTVEMMQPHFEELHFLSWIVLAVGDPTQLLDIDPDRVIVEAVVVHFDAQLAVLAESAPFLEAAD